MGSSENSDSIGQSDTPQLSNPPIEGEAVQSVLLRSFAVSGDLIADETTLIEGEVKGAVLVKDHQVWIGRTGRVVGDVFGKSIIVEGKVNGNLCAQENLTLCPTSEVLGNLVAAQVKLEDGCRFRGTVDMDDRALRAALSSAGKKISTALSKDQRALKE